MRVTDQFQDFQDPDGFPNVMVLDNGYVVVCTEKRGYLLDQDGKVCDSSYKSGFRNHPQAEVVNRALEEIDVQVRDFISPIRWIYDKVTEETWNKN